MKPGHPVIDVLDFISRNAEQRGETPLSAFSRISDLLPAQVLPVGDADSAGAVDGLVRWSVRGERTQHGKRYLHLEVSARPILICQRCMRPFVYEVESVVPLEVVTHQAALDEDSEIDDPDMDAPDRILAQASQSVLELVEDELILSLPYIPRHDYACVQYDNQETPEGTDKKPSPFAALAALKKQ
ncbi:hypothetical protein CAP48_09615 [Advenella sp. S44]|uniref:YceD family protein n=1 Tax=Advenella sp. S44 TaxID=1982755 RepID=UPI000C2A8164|nr:YceD family protein [Advenella sp. S44]PJX26243.1 hypothetical protein CAP48_09615 [Advenella sp. S44]